MLVNVHVKDLRKEGKYNNLQEFIQDKNNIYIGRCGVVFIDGERYPKQSSVFANPFKLKDYSLSDSLKKYEEYIRGQGLDFSQLKGKTLGCWCVKNPKTYKDQQDGKPNECHGDILLKILHEKENEKEKPE